MENHNENGGFSYTYSAKEQEELKKIREKYTAPSQEEDKMARLRRLDKSVSELAQAVAIAFGVIGALLLGFGMSLIMTELADSLSLSRTAAMVIGIVGGIVGGTLASFAYPVYHAIVKARRKKLAPEIIRLTDELMK